MIEFNTLKPSQYRCVIDLCIKEKVFPYTSDAFTYLWNDSFVGGRKELWAIERAGQLVGSAGYSLAEATDDEWLIAIIVQPSQRRCGIASCAYTRLLNVLGKQGARRLLSSVHVEQQAGMHFLEQRGFRAIGSVIAYQLRVADADVSGWSDPDALLTAQGLRFVTLECFPRRGLAARLLPLWNSTRPDQPQYWPYVPYYVQRFEREMLDPPEVALPHSIAILAADGHMVAFTLQAYVSDSTLYSTYMAVDPAFRGRGLAHSLKRKLLAQAQQHGIAVLAAENDARNGAMRRINEQAGYRQVSELVVYEKVLVGGENALLRL
jgi:GNAT superfamily N-acetyltransferase